MTYHEPLSESDPAIAELIAAEARRQQESIDLIASENYASAAVREAAGSVLTNKYAEGYPGKRYYGGCEVVDQVEQLAIDRCKELFGAEHANVQPHSGSQANDAAMAAILQPGDAILSLDFAAGGHLTHGHPLSFSGKRYRVISYGVSRETETIDYDRLREVALAERPALVICGASAYPRTIDFARIRAIADEAGARMLADIAHISGLVATGLHPSPVPYADIVTSTTHKTLRGPRGGVIMCRAELAAGVDRAVFPGAQGGPLLHAIAAKAVAFGEALRPEFREYQERVLASAAAMAETLERRGFRVVSGGTDTHLVLVDVASQGLTGKAAETALERVGITANKNLIPHDARPPADPSGLRIGTPAICTRGMGPREATEIAHLVADVLAAPEDDETRAHVAEKARQLAARFPIPA